MTCCGSRVQNNFHFPQISHILSCFTLAPALTIWEPQPGRAADRKMIPSMRVYQTQFVGKRTIAPLGAACIAFTSVISRLFPHTPSHTKNHIHLSKLIILFIVPLLSTLPSPIGMPFSTLSTWKMFCNLLRFRA